MAGRETSRLLQYVSARQRAVSLSRCFYYSLLAFAAVYALLLLCSRLLGLIPDWWFAPESLVLPVVVAAAAALVFHRSLREPEAARLVDKSEGTKDLFLTTVLIERCVGEFSPLVVSAAAQRAGEIKPKDVVPFRWQAKAMNIVGALAILALGVLFLPQLDPFGRHEARRRIAERRKELDDSRKATALRKSILKTRHAAASMSKGVEQAIDSLKKSFKGMKPAARKANLRRMAFHKKELGDLWRKAREKKLKDALADAPTSQRFGAANRGKGSEWKRQLAKGDPSGVKKEMDELKDLAKKLSETDDPIEREKLKQEIKSRLEAVADCMSSGAGSRPLNDALKRALQQLATSGTQGLSQDALQALRESLDLSNLELDALAQSMRDLKGLEQALRALQSAKRLNDQDRLDGGACEGCMTIDDYAKLFDELSGRGAGQCAGGRGTGGWGDGPGTGGAGRGRGGIVPEDRTVDTDFRTEASKSALTSGKILMEWKTRGLSDPGKADQAFKEHLKAIKQGVSEAVLQEQIPAGYREAIRKYFDVMEKDVGRKPKP